MWYQVYAKAVVAVSAALGVLATALADGEVTGSEWVAIAVAFLGALGVSQVPNKDNSGSTSFGEYTQ